jgi:hypothetical protein
MEYTDLAGLIPSANIVQALDDDGDGVADTAAWTSVQAIAADRIADCFGGPAPARHATAAAWALKVFLCEILYGRRGLSEGRNPFTTQAAAAETRLRKLATGQETPEGVGGGEIYTTPAKIAGISGLAV